MTMTNVYQCYYGNIINMPAYFSIIPAICISESKSIIKAIHEIKNTVYVFVTVYTNIRVYKIKCDLENITFCIAKTNMLQQVRKGFNYLFEHCNKIVNESVLCVSHKNLEIRKYGICQNKII